MLIYKATNTLEGYLPPLDYTKDQNAAEIFLVGGKKFVLAEFPNLKGIFKTGVGTDNLPFDEAKQRGVAISLPSESTCNIIFEETAAFSCHLILTGLYAENGDWNAWKKVDRPQLATRKLLVIGAGRIGKRVCEKMQPFMQVDSFDIAHNAVSELDTKIKTADCISLHVPLTDSTREMFNKERLALMPDGALLVNTARGPVIDEDALYQELLSGRLRAACDVFWHEPYRGRLAELPEDRFIRTPHISSTCREFLQGTANDFIDFMQTIEGSK
nr:NAD(P)-dependent oxidoreductase [uncultured Desulfobulbus sp.]